MPSIYPGLKSCWMWPRSWAQQLWSLTHAEVADPLYCIDEGPVFRLGPVSPLLVFLCFMLRHSAHIDTRWKLSCTQTADWFTVLGLALYRTHKWNSLVYFSLYSLYTKCFVSDLACWWLWNANLVQCSLFQVILRGSSQACDIDLIWS